MIVEIKNQITYTSLISYIEHCDAICINTNGSVINGKNKLEGYGAELDDTYINISKKFGKKILENGHKVQIIDKIGKTNIISFPTKPGDIIGTTDILLPQYIDQVGTVVKGWMCKPCINQIIKSHYELSMLKHAHGWKTVFTSCPVENNEDWEHIMQNTEFTNVYSIK